MNKFVGHLEQSQTRINSYAKKYALSFSLLKTVTYFFPAYGLFLGGIFITEGVSD